MNRLHKPGAVRNPRVHSGSIKFRIEKDGTMYKVVDAEGHFYGPPKSAHKEAETVLADWEAYYHDTR